MMLHLRRPRRAHQRRHPGLRGGPEAGRQDLRDLRLRGRQPRLQQRHQRGALRFFKERPSSQPLRGGRRSGRNRRPGYRRIFSGGVSGRPDSLSLTWVSTPPLPSPRGPDPGSSLRFVRDDGFNPRTRPPAPAADHEGVRHEAERGGVDFRLARIEQLVEAPVDGLVFGGLLLHHLAAVDLEAAAAMGELEGQAGFRLDLDVPGLRAGLAPVEDRAEIAAAVAGTKARSAAIGASRLAGNSRSAGLMKTGSGMMLVTMESALMPGSNTPKPPASQIHCWPGCQCRTSSFQVTRSRLTVQPARAFLASSTALLYCACQVVKTTLPAFGGES